MNFSSIANEVELKDLTEVQFIAIFEKCINYFYKLENLSPIKLQLTQQDVKGLLFAGTLFNSLREISPEYDLNYELILKHQLEKYQEDGCQYKINILDNVKQKGGGISYVTEFILFTKHGYEYMDEIRAQFKKYSNKQNYVNTIKSFYSNTINNYTVNIFLKSNPAISESTYFNGHFLLQHFFENTCLGEKFETNQIYGCLDSILKLETNVTLDQYFSIIANCKTDGTELYLFFLNYLIEVVQRFDTLEYIKFWNLFFTDKIYSSEFTKIFCKCIRIKEFCRIWLSFLEAYLKCVRVYEGNVAAVTELLDDQYKLFSSVCFKDVARLCFLFNSKTNNNRLEFLDNLKNLSSPDVHRLLCLKMLNYKK